MKLPSASQMSRVMRCPVSRKLPQFDVSEESSEKGTAVHRFLEEYANGGATDEARDLALEKVPVDYREVCERLDLGSIPADWKNAKSEVRFLYYPETDTSTELPHDSDDLPDDCVPAKADLVVEVPEENGLIVIDYKSGRGKLDPAFENWQMRTLAVAADRARPGHAWIHCILLYLDCETGESRVDPARFDSFQVHAFAGMIWEFCSSTLPAADVGNIAHYHLGSWCRFCPALRVCGAQRALVNELIVATEPGIAMDESLRRVGIEPAQLGKGWRRLEAIDAMVKVAKQFYHALASQEPIDLGNGEVLGEHAVPGKRKIDGRAAFEWLRTEFDDDIALEAMSMDVSQKAIRETMKRHKKPQAPTLRNLMESLEHQGKIKRKESYRVEVYRPGAPLPESGED